MWLFTLGLIYAVVGRCSPQPTCSGRCNTEQSQRINVTVPNSVTIPCGDLLSPPNSSVDYCNYTNGVNKPLDTGATTQYTLTPSEPSYHDSVISCTNSREQECYMLNVFFAPFVPSGFIPLSVSRECPEPSYTFYCPFNGIGNPRPNCTWSRIDSNNITHDIQIPGPKITLSENDTEYCAITYAFTENDNGLYQCVGHNSVGSTTYTFPERFIVENCSRCEQYPRVPAFILREPTNVDGNVTFLCNASSITRNALLYWVVDGVTYNMTGTFSSSRGQLVVEQSPVDTIICRISSSLTVLNVQLNSQGVYTCNLQDNNVTMSRNRSLMVDVERSTEESSVAPILGSTIGVVGFLAILTVTLVTAVVFYHHHRKFKYRSQLHEPDFDYEYDVFLSFAQEDLENVEKIYKALENNHNYRVVWHHRDFTVGVSSQQNMEEFIQKSRKIVIVITQAFLQSDHCKSEYAIAYSRLDDNKENCIVTVLMSSCPVPKEIKFLRHLNFKHSCFMEYLINNLGKPICEAKTSL